MFSGSNTMITGGTFNYQNRASRGIDILMEWVATDAFHNSDELYDAPKCHPRTRVAVLDDIMEWISQSEDERDEFMLWLFGAAGAGKSAIAKRIAEIAAERDLLIGDFFFSRTSPTRNTRDRLIATLAYQLTVSIPSTRHYIEDAIERDPALFDKNIQTQINTLLIKPFQSISSTQIFPSQKLIVIDGLDECDDTRAQVAILEAISRSFTHHNFPITFLVASRPEPDLVTAFNSDEPLRFVHRRLALDDTYRPNDDIYLFLSEKFEHIKHTHPLKSTIPILWPTQEQLNTLVSKSSGQFIYASTVAKFVESRRHQPSVRLNVILGVSPPGKMNPFAELDALYDHLLSSVDDIQITLRVLSFYVMTPDFISKLYDIKVSPEVFLSLEPGDIQLALLNLSSILTYHESSGAVEVLHASFVDFLSDKRRSTTFYVDKANTCTDFVCRILQYVKGPDGILAGNIRLFRALLSSDLCLSILKDQVQNDILNFDFDAFVNVSIRWLYHQKHVPLSETPLQFQLWEVFLDYTGLDDRDKKQALDRLTKSFESRLHIYQSDWRLQLLLTLAFADIGYHSMVSLVPRCRCVDILLEMYDHNLHLSDQNALDFRHVYAVSSLRLIDTIPISSYVDGDAYASAALHCMRFLSNPPHYSETNKRLEMGLIYAEWKATCYMTLEILCGLLPKANTSPELVHFVSNHYIHPEIQYYFSAGSVTVLDVDLHILAFLSRANMCVNWRIISAIHVINDRPPSKFDENEKRRLDRLRDEREAIGDLIHPRLDRCCSNVDHGTDYFC